MDREKKMRKSSILLFVILIEQQFMMANRGNNVLDLVITITGVLPRIYECVIKLVLLSVIDHVNWSEKMLVRHFGTTTDHHKRLDVN